MIDSEVKIINLATQKSGGTIDVGMKDIFLMDGVAVAKIIRILEDVSDMVFPEATRFGMALKCALDRDHQGTIDRDIEFA